MEMTEKRNRATLQDIADRVGMTKMTVSRYMRNPESVAPGTRDKIAAVIEQLGYIQNRVPAMLSKASSKAIGIVLPSLSNQVFAHLVQGIERVTQAHGYDILITHAGYSEQAEEEKIASLLSYQVDGLILTETNHTPRTLQMLKTAAIPVVETMELPDTPIDMAVGLDHEQAAYDAVQAMINKGKTQIVYLAARLDTRTQLRRKGYERAMKEAGLTPRCVATEQHSSFSLGETLLNQTLARYPNCDGLFCTNDDLAVGALLACKEQGIGVPEALGIVGYNALDIGTVVSPRLTSVATPRELIGERSATLLIQALSGETITEKVHAVAHTITDGTSL
ncbi:substrate-binding domain-containing protein [Salinivibrio socompensis]|uniref:substrate-binding domain-containing protein n=1 Tax=Salinivibrio socompensis TaxID=1510206 RepID=UPI00047080BD